MNNYQCSFVGKLNGAIGRKCGFEIQVQADSIEAARIKIYDTHEHLERVTILLIKEQAA